MPRPQRDMITSIWVPVAGTAPTARNQTNQTPQTKKTKKKQSNKKNKTEKPKKQKNNYFRPLQEPIGLVPGKNHSDWFWQWSEIIVFVFFGFSVLYFFDWLFF
jgi:hypothetical protein